MLVFPPHSTNEGRADLGKIFLRYLDFIKDNESDFSEIGVSLYGLDYVPEVLDKVKKYNFKIIPGVNWNDRNALKRLRFNLKRYEFSTTNNIGSHFLYSLYAGHKFSFSGEFVELDEESFLKQVKHEENFVWPQSSIENTIERYSLKFVKENYSRFFASSPSKGIQDTAFANKEIGVPHKIENSQLKELMGWTFKEQIKGYSKKIASKVASRGEYKLDKSSNSLYIDDEVLIFVDTQTHLQKSLSICKEMFFKKVTFITSSLSIKNLLKIKDEDVIFYSGRLDLLKKIFNTNVINQKTLIAARVDDLDFQIIHSILKPEKLYTFDEGLFTILNESRYNSVKFLREHHGNKAFILNMIFNFPKNPSHYYNISKTHFTWFEADFSKTFLNRTKIIKLENKFDNDQISSVFIGQPFKNMYFSDIAIERLFKFINNLNPSLYLTHPRDDLHVIQKYLNPNITLISSLSPSENLCNKLIITNPEVQIYSIASTLVNDLRKSENIFILKSKNFPKMTNQSQNELIGSLRSANKKFKSLYID